ncbi:MAG: ABC transporter permease [Flavobacteriales bacterium]
MSKLKIIIKREYLNKVQKKSFLILTILTPILLLAFGGVIGYLSIANKSDQEVLYVYDESKLFTEDDFKDTERFDFQYVDALEGMKPKSFLEGKTAHGLLFIPKQKRDNLNDLGKTIKIYSDQTPNLEGLSYISGVLEKRYEKIKMEHYNIDTELLEKSKVTVDISYVSSNNEEKDEKYSQVRIGIGFVLSIILYMFIFMYGAQVMRSVLEEKTTRVIEVVISSVQPFQLMFGKIISTVLVVITQLAIWGIITVVVSLFLPSPDTTAVVPVDALSEDKLQAIMNSDFILDAIHAFNTVPLTNIIVAYIIYFSLGYLLYSSLFAAIGAASDSETDSQQFMLPVSLPLVLALYVGMIGLKDNPDGPVGMFMSMFPLTSPITMMFRIPFGVPIWQQVLSITILVVTILFAIKIASKIYQVGLLHFGKKASYKDLWKWIRQKD